MKRILLFFSLLLSTFYLYGQIEIEDDPCIQKMEKNIEKEFKRARELHQKGKKNEAYKIYYEILDEIPDNLEVNYYVGLGYYLPIEMAGLKIERPGEARKALNAFKRMYEVCPFYKIHVHLYAARIAYLLEDFSEAITFATVLIENPDLIKKIEYLQEADKVIQKSKFYKNILENPVDFYPVPVPGISTPDDEYLATISPDDEYFYFTRRKRVRTQNSYFGDNYSDKEFFSFSKRDSSGTFGVGEPLPYPFNQDGGNEGSPAVNLRNDLLIFTKMSIVRLNNHNYPNYDLYYSEWLNGEWTAPQSIGSKINRKDSWESQPSLSANGNLLFFASDRPGGFGGSDIWYAERNADGTWGDPKNMGPTINTAKNERSPFLHTDSKTLYFSSDGHDGMGGMDVFYSKLGDKGWEKPVNVGYPINSEKDEVDFFVNLKGDLAFFSSNHIEGNDWNIYQFELHPEARPEDMLLVKGEVADEDGNTIEAVVQIRDAESNIIAETIVNEASGRYAIATTINKEEPQELIVNVKKDGYAYDTRLITIEQQTEQVVTDNVDIKKIEVGKTYDLHDIYFETNSYSLSDQSKMMIDIFIEFLIENPTLHVEIQGHTDDIGSDEDNQILSEKRAHAVYLYIINKNISSHRLKYKGYGESQPIASNVTEKGRAKNRRTVFLILE